jgi:hypothetical protein
MCTVVVGISLGTKSTFDLDLRSTFNLLVILAVSVVVREESKFKIEEKVERKKKSEEM